jgi:hypothetical protein
MNDDSIFREVDEAVRSDQVKALWDKYGVWILLAAFALVGGVAAFNGWNYWQARQAADAGGRFAAALQLEEAGKSGEVNEALQPLAEDGPWGYRILARFQLAAAAANSGDKANAVKAYDALADEISSDELLRDYAVIQAATLRLDEANFDEISDRLNGLANSESPWRHSARELVGLSAYRNGKPQEAEDQFGRLLADQTAPINLRRRAEMMLALLVRPDAAPSGQ